jgi:hypothetical protein
MKLKIFILFFDPLRVLGQKLCQKIDHFFPGHPKNLIFHKNLDVFFLKFLDTYVGNNLLVDDTPYKFIFNDLCSAIFLESFEGVSSNGDYLFSTILPCLVSLHSFRFNAQTYVKHNFFGTNKSIS